MQQQKEEQEEKQTQNQITKVKKVDEVTIKRWENEERLPPN